MNLPNYLNYLLAVLVLALIAFTGVLTWNAYSEHSTIGRPPDVRDTITLSGTGRVDATPDVARVTLGVVSEAKEVAPAQDENTQKMNAIIAAMKSLGIKDEDLKTQSYNVFPQYDYVQGRELNGYQVQQNVVVTIRDTKKVGDVLAKAGELGANQVYGVNFEIDDPEALEHEARAIAIADARDKAELLAKELGLQLIRVISFSEDGGGYPTPYPTMAEARDVALGAPSAPPTIEPGSQEVKKNVTVTFEVR